MCGWILVFIDVINFSSIWNEHLWSTVTSWFVADLLSSVHGSTKKHDFLVWTWCMSTLWGSPQWMSHLPEVCGETNPSLLKTNYLQQEEHGMFVSWTLACKMRVHTEVWTNHRLCCHGGRTGHFYLEMDYGLTDQG